MAVLIIALFVIVVVWGWYLVPKKSGAHKSSTLNVRGRRLASRSPQPPPGATSDVTVARVATAARARIAPVPDGAGSGAFARRQRVRTVLVGAAVVSLAAALYTGSISWWWLHVAIDGLLVIYYGLALQFRENRGVGMTPTVSRPQEESPPVLRKVVGG